MTTTNMSLNEPSVGVTTGPDWATQVNENFETIDTHDHTSGKGVQLTPSALNINADLEFNQNSATELKNVIFDSSVTAATTSYSVYQSGGNLYWRNGSGTAVQITSGSGINTSGGSISNMTGNAQVQFSNVNNSYTFKFDSTLTDGIAKVVVSDLQLYFYNSGSATTRSVNLKYTGSGTGSNTLTVPDETGTLLSTATSFAGAISVGATGGSGSITLDAQTDINLDSDSGVINFKDGGTAIGKISNSSSDLVIENEVDAKDIIFKQYDGNEVVRMADDRRLYFFDKGGEYIVGDGTDLTVASGAAINLNAGTLDLSAQTVDVTLNGAVDALNFDSNTLSIDASDNRIGIGTAAPETELDMGAGQIRLDNTKFIYWDDHGGTLRNAIRRNANEMEYWSHPTNSGGQGTHLFKVGITGGSTIDALKIDSSGNVGIGVTPESVDTNYRALQVAGTAGLQGTASQAAGSIVALTNNVYRATDQTWKYIVADEASRYDQFDGTHVFRVAGSGSADATISFSDALTIANNKNVTIHDGDLVIGTAGHGITFGGDPDGRESSATAGNRTLYDYEEGSYSGVVKLGTTTNTVGGSYYRYTKIGDVVHIWGEVNTISKSGSGTLTVQGLPFATISGQMNVNVQVRWAGIATNEGTLIGTIAPGDSQMTFQDFNTSGFAGVISDSAISSTYHLYSFNAYYRTT